MDNSDFIVFAPNMTYAENINIIYLKIFNYILIINSEI